MSKPKTTAPHEVFALLQSWWALQTGFGLVYLFSDDALALNWLRERIQEEVLHTHHTQAHSLNTFQHWGTGEPSQLFLDGTTANPRCLHWIALTANNHAQWLGRLNEQRQRLIASDHLFVLTLPPSLALDTAGMAPDLWSVRSQTYQLRSQHFAHNPVTALHAEHTAYATGNTNSRTSDLSLNMDAWRRLFDSWSSKPEPRKRLSVRLGLQAQADATQLHQFDLARTIGQEVIEVSQVQNDDLGRANALQALGDLDSRLGLVNSARTLYTQAIALYEKEQDDWGRANALQALGDLDTRLGQVDSARALYIQAMALFESEQSDLGRANTLQALGDLDSRLGHVDSARAFYTQAIALYDKEQNDLGRANALKALGDVDSRLGRIDSAHTLYTQAITLYEKEQHDLGRANALRALGDLDSCLGQVDSARDLYTQAIALYEKERDDLGRANALQALGDVDRNLGQVGSARTLYTQAVALYEKVQAPAGLAYAWAELARLSTPLDAAMAEKSKAYARQSQLPPVIAAIAALLEPPTSTI